MEKNDWTTASEDVGHVQGDIGLDADLHASPQRSNIAKDNRCADAPFIDGRTSSQTPRRNAVSLQNSNSEGTAVVAAPAYEHGMTAPGWTVGVGEIGTHP